jgi:hypothetical protein
VTSPVPTAPADRHVFDESRSWNGAGTRARTIANVVLIAAGVAAACVVLANPRARRVAQRVVRNWLGASVPMYLLAEAGRAWVETGRRA